MISRCGCANHVNERRVYAARKKLRQWQAARQFHERRMRYFYLHHGIARKFFQKRAGNFKRDNMLHHHARRGNGADIGTLIRAHDGFLSV